jgi:hypothetical protein
MANVTNEFNQKCWVPGIVQHVVLDDSQSYTILYFNGQENENIRRELIRINKKTYCKIVQDIRDRLGLRYTGHFLG